MMLLFSDIFGKFADLTPSTIAILVLLSVAGLGGNWTKSRRVRFTTWMLVYASVSVALSFVLSTSALSHASGWKITPGSMLPMIIYAYIFDPFPASYGNGLWYAPVYSDHYIVHWAPVLLTYPVAFGMLGIAGFFRKTCCWAVLLPSRQVLMHFLTGILFCRICGDQHAALYS